RWSYDTQSWIESLPGQFLSQDFPLDALYLDIDYMDSNHDNNYDDGTCHQLSFNEWFPNPAGMISHCASNHVKLVPILEPCITTQDTKWSEGNSGQYFVKDNNGFSLVSATGFFSDLSWIDYSKTTARTWWKNKVLTFLNAFPFDGLWNDLN